MVFGFDVQAAAITATAQRVQDHPQVTLFQASHENLSDHLPQEGKLAGAMFNLGYLPGGSREIMTCQNTSIAALGQTLERLKIKGLVTLVLYPGHAGGDNEATSVRAFAKNLGEEFMVAQYRRLNFDSPAPELLVIERTR